MPVFRWKSAFCLSSIAWILGGSLNCGGGTSTQPFVSGFG